MKTSEILLLGCAIAGMAWGDCVDGVRAASPAEIAFKSKAQLAMAELFPAAPEGFKQPAPLKLDDRPPSFCKGQPPGDFPMSLHTTYERSTAVRERDTPEYAAKAEIDAKIQALKKLTPESQAKYDAAKKEYDIVYAPYRVAVKANNKAEGDRMRKDVDAAYANMRKVEEEHRRDMLPKTTALTDEREKINAQMRDKYYAHVVVMFSVNDRFKKLEGKGWTLGSIAKPALKVRSLIYQFNGPEAEVEKFMGKVDQSKLKALIGLQ